jgi:hypothetical protein
MAGDDQHALQAEDPLTGEPLYLPFTAYVHGYKQTASYAYPAGMITQ